MTVPLAGRRAVVVGGRAVASTYKAMLYVGCVLGVYAGTAVADRDGLPATRFAWVAMGLLVPALLGARLWFLARHGGSLAAALPRHRHEGGAGLYGGLVLGVAASVPVLAVAGLPFLRFWDAASVTMLVGLVVTRFGCLANGCCGGRPTSSRFGLWLPDVAGEWRRRIPTQLLEAAWATVVLVVVVGAGGSPPPFAGARFAFVVAAYSTARLGLQTLRART